MKNLLIFSFLAFTLPALWHLPEGERAKMNNEDLTPIVYDDRGVKFEPIRKPERIVSLAPSLTEMIKALDLAQSLVGVTLWDSAIAPTAEVVIGREGTISLEVLLSLKPQAVIATTINSFEDIERMERLGLKVFYLKAENLEEILHGLRKLGALLMRAKRANRLADSLYLIEKRIKECASSLKKDRVFLLLDTHGGLWTAGRGTFLDDLVTRAGGVNIFSDIEGWKSVSPEALLLKNPDVIILGWGADSSILDEPPLKELKAVHNKRVFRSHDPDMLARPGIHTVDALRWLVRVLHPGQCE